MSGYTRSHIVWLVDNTNTPVGVVGRDGREWTFPAGLAAGSDGGARMVEGRVLFDTTDTPIGFYVNGREFIFSSSFTLNTTRGYRTNRFALLVNSSGVPCGLRAGFATVPMLFASLPVENGSTSPLRWASPNNAIQNSPGIAATGTNLHLLSRRVRYIGSGDRSELRVIAHGYNLNAATVTLNANAYTVEKYALERPGIAYVPVTWGGLRTKVVNPGDVWISDPVLPSSFSQAVFALDSQWYDRQELSVSAAGLLLPTGTVNYTVPGFPANVGMTVDPATSTAGVVDAVGNMAVGNGVGFNSPFQTLMVGRFVSGDPRTITGLGDSIMANTGDTAATGTTVLGAFSRSLFDGTGLAGAIGGCDLGSSGSVVSMWQSANGLALAAALFPYGKHAVDEFQTNYFNTVQSAPAAEAQVQALWALCRTYGVQSIIRTMLTPRTTSGDGWTSSTQPFTNASWAAAGGARAFNDWLSTQIGPTGITTLLQILGVRNGTDPATDAFYTWAFPGYTADGIHPSTLGHTNGFMAEYRPAFLALP